LSAHRELRQQRLAEIAATIGESRNRRNTGVDELRFAKLLEIEKEEALVAAVVQLSQPYRTTNAKPIVVFSLCVPDVLSGSTAVACADSVRKWRTGIQRLVDEIVIDSAMELIRTRPHRVIEIAAAGLAELGGIIAGLNGNFLDGLHTCLDALVI